MLPQESQLHLVWLNFTKLQSHDKMTLLPITTCRQPCELLLTQQLPWQGLRKPGWQTVLSVLSTIPRFPQETRKERGIPKQAVYERGIPARQREGNLHSHISGRPSSTVSPTVPAPRPAPTDRIWNFWDLLVRCSKEDSNLGRWR